MTMGMQSSQGRRCSVQNCLLSSYTKLYRTSLYVSHWLKSDVAPAVLSFANVGYWTTTARSTMTSTFCFLTYSASLQSHQLVLQRSPLPKRCVSGTDSSRGQTQDGFAIQFGLRCAFIPARVFDCCVVQLYSVLHDPVHSINTRLRASWAEVGD